MDRHVQALLNRLSCVAVTIATFTLLLLFIRTPETCISDSDPRAAKIKFPRSSCDSTHREIISLEKKNRRLWSTKIWRKNVDSYTELFHGIQSMGFLTIHSRVLCVSAGAGHEVKALLEMGVTDVTGVELIDSLPLDNTFFLEPHNSWLC